MNNCRFIKKAWMLLRLSVTSVPSRLLFLVTSIPSPPAGKQKPWEVFHHCVQQAPAQLYALRTLILSHAASFPKAVSVSCHHLWLSEFNSPNLGFSFCSALGIKPRALHSANELYPPPWGLLLSAGILFFKVYQARWPLLSIKVLTKAMVPWTLSDYKPYSGPK